MSIKRKTIYLELPIEVSFEVGGFPLMTGDVVVEVDTIVEDYRCRFNGFDLTKFLAENYEEEIIKQLLN